jgi:hypothetical protein
LADAQNEHRQISADSRPPLGAARHSQLKKARTTPKKIRHNKVLHSAWRAAEKWHADCFVSSRSARITD